MQKNAKAKFILLPIVLAVALFAGCKGTGKNTDQTGGQGAFPQDDGSIRGVITEIRDNAIVIAKMPSMGNPDGTMGGRPGGNGTAGSRPGGTMPGNRPSGTVPGNRPTPNPNASPMTRPSGMPQMDTSGWEKVTYKVDEKTKVTEIQFTDNKQTTKALTMAELTVGANVSVTTRSGDETTADTISITQGMGFVPGGSNGNRNNGTK